MSKSKNYFISAVIGINAWLTASLSFAMLPTIDVSAIAEGVKSNIELVKQSTIVTKATKFAGEINSTIGSAKASLSELGVEEAKKVAEKLKKQKENLEEAKEKYEEYKTELEEKKQKLEEAKAKAEEYKNKAEEGISSAMEKVNEAKSAVSEGVGDAMSKVNEAKSAVQSGMSEVQSGINEAKGLASDVQSGINEARGMASDVGGMVSGVQNKVGGLTDAVSSGRQTFSTPVVSTPVAATTASYGAAPGNVSSVNEEDLLAAQNEITRLRSELAAVGNTTQETMDTPQDLQQAQEEIERLQAQISALKGENEGKDAVSQGKAGLSENITAEPQAAGAVAQPSEDRQTLQPVENSGQSSAKTFRSRPSVNVNESFYEKQSFLQNQKNEIFVASAARTEILSFAQASEGGDSSGEGIDGLMNVPTGKNAKTDEFIFSDKLARYCNINVNQIEDQSVIENCLKKLIEYRSDPNSQVAAEGNALYTEVMQETVSALTAEAMATKNKSANYEDEVLSKVDEDLSSASTIRDDVNALSQTNKQIQILLNDILKTYAAQLSFDALDSLSRYNSKYVSSETESEETSSGGEKQNE